MASPTGLAILFSAATSARDVRPRRSSDVTAGERRRNTSCSAASTKIQLTVEDVMSQVERFALLLRELERVGVDPDRLGAGVAARQQDVLEALARLPDGAGPDAFFTQLRRISAERPANRPYLK
jgi:hypothetical protein